MSRSRLSNLPTESLIAELRMRATLVERLQRQRAALIQRIAELDRQIKAAAPERVKGVRRKRNERPLVEALAEALDGRQMDITEAAEAVVKAGYVSNATNLYAVVAQSLGDPKRFRRVRRGVYTSANPTAIEQS